MIPTKTLKQSVCKQCKALIVYYRVIDLCSICLASSIELLNSKKNPELSNVLYIDFKKKERIG